MTVLAQHSKASVEHGTPHAIVEMAARVMGRIDVDPCSNAYWNRHVVRAVDFYTAEDDPLDPDFYWKVDPERRPAYFINPPGGLVKEFWRFAVSRYQEGACVFWVGFSLEQLAYLQREGAMFAGFRRCIPTSRLAFLQDRRSAVESLRKKAKKLMDDGKPEKARRLRERARELASDLEGAPVPGTQPTHANYLILLSDSLGQRELFEAEARALGAEPF